jgi:outer membrane protein TolC
MRLARSIVGLLVCPLTALSQQPVPQTITLATAIAIARDNNPAYRQSLITRGPATWGVRNAYASLLPSVTASGGVGYTGTGQQLFLTSAFNQQVSTWSSSYSIGLDWELSGATLSQPGLRRAQLAAVDADVRGAEVALVSNVTQQYLTVLQAGENARVARAQLEHNDEFLKLAQARFDVGRATLIDVRQAQVARGQAQVALLRARTATEVEMLRLFEVLGVAAPDPVSAQQLADTFPVQEPAWRLGDLLTMAEAQNPSLAALRARENAANWGVRAASSSYGPSLSFSAGWSGYTQKATDLTPVINQVRAQADTNIAVCQYQNTAWLNPGQPALPCSLLAFSPESIQTLRDRNNAYPFHFISQPFQARFTITLPLFTNFSRPLQVSQASAQRDDLTESVRARGLQVRTEVSQAFLVLETAYRAIGIQDTNRTAAQEQLQLATERYRVGSGTFFELLDAQVAQLNAEYDYVNAVYAYHKAVAVLETAVGRPLR